MLLKQISVFAENRVGALSGATSILKDNNINIRALSIADTSDFGIIRLIVDNPDLAAEKFREASLVVNVTDVIGVKLPDKPGAFHGVLEVLSSAGIMIEYSYAFVSRNEGEAYVILRVQDEQTAIEVLSKNGVEFLDKAD